MEKSVNDGLDYSGDAAVGPFFGLDYKKIPIPTIPTLMEVCDDPNRAFLDVPLNPVQTGPVGVGNEFWPPSDMCFVYSRHDDLKQMLDSNRDNLKLEAMKRIIGMVAKGRDASDLFPAVVKNVVSKNPEVKKLVYVYLVRYAEEQQDCALLSISTFQRALKDPNQLIRASALRVLSSIRVPMIVPIVMLAIRDASSDMSPYVRKTAAHAIPKLYSLDPDQKEELVSVLDKLLADRTTLVVGSAVMAFEEVCPERIDLIHKNYRKLCALLMDVDEWGQVVIVNMLTRYARTQFVDPNIGDLTIDGEEKPFYDDEDHENGKVESSKEESSGEESDGKQKSKIGKGEIKKEKESSKPKAEMDVDHRLLLKNARPLLQSRNSSVVMAVAQLYYHVAPKMEVNIVIKALIRLLRSHTEVQAVVLSSIAAMSTNRQSLFEPYMKSFFVRSSDPTQIKLLKLEILTNIANEANISFILREFQAYISSQDKEFVAATIQAIGRCASNIKQVAETCLNGLVSLLSHRDPAVVGGAVVVAKTLLQTQKSGTKPVIAQLAKMVDRVTVAPARAAILWLLGEHCERLPHLPPDVLRKMAKTFPEEEDIVKLQIINLAAKLQLTNPSQTTLLCQYVLNLAKYDQSYDIRDRARFIRHILFPENTDSKLSKYARKILLSSKPAPVLQSKFKDREQFQLGSLSHFLNNRAMGYQDLPRFPEEAPDHSERNVEPPASSVSNNDTTTEFGLDLTGTNKKGKKKQNRKRASFYSDTEESEGKSEGTKSGSSSSGSGSASSSSSSGSGSSSGTDDSDSDSTDSGSGDSQDTGNSDREENGNEKLSSTKLKKDTGGKGSGPGDKRNVKDSQPDRKKVIRYKKEKESDSEGESGSSNSSPEVDGSSSSEDSKEENIQSKKSLRNNAMSKQKSKGGNAKSNAKGKEKTGKSTSNVDMLLDFSPDSNAPSENLAPGLMSSLSAGIMTPNASSSSRPSSAAGTMGSIQSASPMFIPTKRSELLNKIASGGLQICSRFTRAPHLFSQSMVSIELLVQNLGKEILKNIRVGQKSLPSGMSVHDFSPIEMIEPGKSVEVTLGVDFHDTTQGAKMEILWETEVESKKQSVTINAPIGELIRPVTMSESLFIAEQGKLRGMNEHEGKTFVNKTLVSTTTTTSRQSLVHRVYETANLLQVPSTEDHLVRFAGQCLSSQTLVLVMIHLTEGESISQDEDLPARVVVNCEKMVVGSILSQELKEALKIGLN